MGTISEKLTYLNTTKQNIKQAINNLGGDITNETTFRQYANVLNDIYDNLPKVSDTGTNVSLSPTLKGRLGIVPKGNTLQDGEPTPETPVEIQSATGTQNVVVSGKNLMPYNTYDANDNRVLSTPNLILNSGTYTISFDLESKSLGSNSSYSVVMGVYFEDSTATDITLLTVDSSTTLGRKNVKFMLNKNVVSNNQANIRIGLTYYNNGARVILNNIKITKEEPQEVDIELSSRNLFDINNQTIKQDYAKDNNGNEIYSLGGNYTTSYTQVKPNTVYTFSYSLSSQVARIYYYTKDKTWISRTDNIKNSNNNYTFTTPNNCYYIQFQNVINFTMSNNIQLEEGTTATSYTPYYNYTPNKIGDYEDYIDGTPDNWVLYKNIGKVVLDGSENWIELTGVSYKTYYVDSLINATRTNDTAPYYSDYFASITNNQRYVNNSFFINSNNRIIISYNDITTVANFKTWLSTHNTELLYVLATETTETITDTNLVSQLNELYYLQSNNDTTNIDVTGNLPMRITASAIKGE